MNAILFLRQEVVMMGDRLEAILGSKRCHQRVSFVREDSASIVFSVSRAAHVLAISSVKFEMSLALGTSVEISDELFGVQQITIRK